MSLFSQEPSLVRLSRLIYGPAGGACHNFLNLKSQPHPPISCSTLARAHCTTCSYVKTCARPLCLYNVHCMCVSRVPRMFVMSTRVSHCMCYLCICIFVCQTCECDPNRRLSPSLCSSCVVIFLVCMSDTVCGCMFFEHMPQISHLRKNLFLYRVSFTHINTQICSQLPTHIHKQPQLEAWPFPVYYLSTSSSI